MLPVKAQDAFTLGPISLQQSAPDFVLIDVTFVLKGSTGDKQKDAALLAAAIAFGCSAIDRKSSAPEFGALLYAAKRYNYKSL